MNAPTTTSYPSTQPLPKLRRTKGGMLGVFSNFWQAFTAPFSHDTQLFYITLGTCLFGLVILFSASAHYGAELNNSKLYYVKMQALYMALGLGVMWICAWFKEARLRRLVWPLAIATLFFLILTQLFGDTANGSERWLNILGIRFQPSELAKPAVALLLASAFSETSPKREERVVRAVLMVLLIIGLIFKQPNLSVTLLLGSGLVATSFVAGYPMWLFLGGLPVGAILLFQKIRSTPYQWRRIEGWLNPWADPQDIGYNIIQSFYAIAGGGFWGMGYGNSVQKLFYLPFQHTDFIFAIICEELGAFGALAVLILFGWFAFRGFRTAQVASTPFKQILAFCLTWLLVVQAVINISVATGLFPVTGVTLPLISYGGTSVVVTLAIIGLLFSLSRPEEIRPTA
jgi:cell division protein FtsW